MRITMLGTGHAIVTQCYNTCLVLSGDDGRRLLVDGGGGSGIVTQMERAGIPWSSIHEVFVTHKHIDHLLGIVWVLRMVGMEMRRGAYEGILRIFGNEETLQALARVASELLWGTSASPMGDCIKLVTVRDGETAELIGRPVTFFDMGARDVSQMGFVMEYEPGRTLVCCGDVCLKERDFPLAQGVDWLLHEAFCLSNHPAANFIYRAGHSTVAEAAKTAARVGARNLLLYHTEDSDLAHRAKRYRAEAAEHFTGTVHVPHDLETLEL